MKFPNKKLGIAILALAITTFGVSAQEMHRGEAIYAHQFSPEARINWIKMQLDKEASLLEIKASQQETWNSYSQAIVELMSVISTRTPLVPGTSAASAVRQHAERAATEAQSLSKLADATDKLQSVLDDNQKKVLDRIVREHSQFGHHQACKQHGRKFDHEHETIVDEPVVQPKKPKK